VNNCKKCGRVLYYESTIDDMCMECWEKFGRLGIIVQSESPPTEWIP